MSEVFLLNPIATGVDIQKLPSGHIALYCGLYLSPEVANEVRIGLIALLQGGFDRATTEAYLAFDLSRRAVRTDRASLTPHTPPTMDML